MATAAIFIVLVLQMLATIEIDWTNPIAVQQYFMDNLNAIWSLAAGAIAAWVVFFIFMVVSALLVRKSLNSLSEKSGEKIFGTAGLLWLIGAVLSIILIGFIVVWISWILVAVGFFSINAASVQPMPVQPAPPPPPQPPQ